jgi:hypothetical protein
MKPGVPLSVQTFVAGSTVVKLDGIVPTFSARKAMPRSSVFKYLAFEERGSV